MQKEKYVSFYTAILLKEKHFFGECHRCYYQYREDNNRVCLEEIHGDSGEVEAPTLQMAIDWIRDEHKIHISITPNRNENDFFIELYRKDDLYGGWEPLSDGDCTLVYTGETPLTINYNTYEEAADTAIQYVLKNFVK